MISSLIAFDRQSRHLYIINLDIDVIYFHLRLVILRSW